MGVLVDVDSESFLLPTKHFASAKRALEALAGEEPQYFQDARSVAAGSEDLEEALAAADWRFDKNKKGDLISLNYGVDKGPDPGGPWPTPVLQALAPFVTRGTIVYRVEGEDRETVYTFADGKVRARTRKRTKEKSAPEAEPAAHGRWIAAPSDSFGIEWRFRLPGEHEWFRKRVRVAAIIEALAKTKVWRELEEVYSRSKQLPIAPKRGALPTEDVVKHIADAQWGTRWLTSRDRQATLELDISVFELGVRLRVRDAALARVGSAAIDEVAAALASYVRAHRGKETAIGHAAPFGRGYMRPEDAVRPVHRGPAVLPSGEIHLRADALCTLFDRRPPVSDDDDDEVDDTAKAIRKLATAKAPRGATRTDEDDVVVVAFPCDLTDRKSVRAAASAHAKWIATCAELAELPSKLGEAKPVAKKARKAADPALVDYELWGRFTLVVDDDPYFFRDHAFFEVVYRALAKTSYWPEVAGPGPAAIDAAIRAVKTGRNDAHAVLKRDEAVSIKLSPNVNELVIIVKAAKPVLTKLRAHATRDLIAFLADVHGALAGRGRVGPASITISSDDWSGFVGLEDHEGEGWWPPSDSVVDIFDPLAPEDGCNGQELYAARALCAAPLPRGAERIAAGGLIAVLFADDLSDPVATADACARRAAWMRAVQSAVARSA